MRTGILAAIARNFVAITASEIGDGSHDALLPQNAIRKARDVRHMDSSADGGSTLAGGPERRRHEFASGRKDQGSIKRLRRQLVRVASPDGAKLAREALPRSVARPGEGIVCPSSVTRNLDRDMSGSPKSVEAETRRLARKS